MEKKSTDPFAELLGDYSQRIRGDRWRPHIDVYETEKTLVVRVELAGVRKQDLKVSVENDRLQILGERLPPADADVLRHHQIEITFGPFECSLHVPMPFERDQVSARFEGGFLNVVLPKRLPTRRRIDVAGETDEAGALAPEDGS